MNETSPLMVGTNGDDGSYGEKKSKNQWIQVGALVLCVFGIGILVGKYSVGGGNSSSSSSSSPKASDSFLPPPLPPAAGGDSPPSSTMRYRPFCMLYGKRAGFAGILQTSMGNPSQQWSHIPCYAQPERVRRWAGGINGAELNGDHVYVNSFGAPDAIFRTNFSQHAFPRRPPIVGFGAAFTEASSLNYQSLSDVGKQRLMELLFGKSGLGYSVGRVHINSCDFSIQSYSFAETDGDFDLADFDMNVTHDAQTDGMIDMILRATAVFNAAWKQEEETNTGVDDGDFKMFASPWSPPSWMKAVWSEEDKKAGLKHASGMTGSTQPSCLREGTGKDSRYAKAWALYFSKFITACK
jgi:glucosylceramidase